MKKSQKQNNNKPVSETTDRAREHRGTKKHQKTQNIFLENAVTVIILGELQGKSLQIVVLITILATELQF